MWVGVGERAQHDDTAPGGVHRHAVLQLSAANSRDVRGGRGEGREAPERGKNTQHNKKSQGKSVEGSGSDRETHRCWSHKRTPHDSTMDPARATHFLEVEQSSLVRPWQPESPEADSRDVPSTPIFWNSVFTRST